jgi:cell division protease FtsH
MIKPLGLLATLCSTGILAAQTKDSLIVNPEVLPATKSVFEQFSTIINWFVYALLLISVISMIRMIIIKRRGGKEPDKPPLESPIPRDPRLPKQKKSGFSMPLVILLILLTIVIYHTFTSGNEPIVKENFSNFMKRVSAQQITQVQFSEKDILYTDLAKKKYFSTLPFENPNLVDSLIAHGIVVSATKPSRWAWIVSSAIPILILVLFYIFFLRGMSNQNSKAFSFGKSKARLHEASKSGITFKDVAGVDEAKEELQEIVEFLKDPKKFQRLGGRIPRGVLLVGRPGTGKTLLAKAVSGEAGVPFFSISGSDFVEMFVGVGAARVRDLFEQAKKNSPCITFIDEIDAVGRHRGTGLGGGHDEREQTLNQLLVEMDGFEPNEAVIIIAATNRPDILDPALLRPGRFDRQVTVDLPDIKGRTEILKVHSAKVPLADDVMLELIARGTPGFSGADLANLVNESALIAASKNKTSIEMHDFEEAKDKLTLGKEKKSRVIPEEDKRLTAFHEIGHVLTSIFLDKTEPVHKVSIIPRGFTGGATHYLLSDKTGYSRSYLKQILVTLLGGRAAEEIMFGELTTGAGNDLERCTDIAKKMVCAWGMSNKIGPMTIGKEQGEIFLGKDIGTRDIYSDETSQIVDREIRETITEAYELAKFILTSHKELMEIMAKELQEKETLGTDEIFQIILNTPGNADLDMVNAKYKKAQELRFEHSESIAAVAGNPELSETPEQES